MNIREYAKRNDKTVKTELFSALGLLGLYKTVKDAGLIGDVWPLLSVFVILFFIYAEYSTVSLIRTDSGKARKIFKVHFPSALERFLRNS